MASVFTTQAIGLRLTPERLDMARDVGIARQRTNAGGPADRPINRMSTFNAGLSDESVHTVGAIGEAALAGWLGYFDDWAANAVKERPPTTSFGDVGPVEIRTGRGFANFFTQYPLRVKPGDSPSLIVTKAILNPADFGHVVLCGWIWAAHAQARPDWLGRVWSKPFYLVPDSELQPMSSLPGELESIGFPVPGDEATQITANAW